MNILQNPAAFWPLTEGTGSTLASLVGGADFNATVHGTAVSWTTLGNGLGALHFDGSTNWIDLTAGKCFRPLTGFSASVWFKRSDTGRQQYLLRGPKAAVGYDWSISLTADDHLYFYNFVATITSSGTITDTNDHCVTLTYTPAGGGLWTLYLDGVSVGTSATAWHDWSPYIGNGAMAGCNDTTLYFAGKMGPIGVWNRCLSGAEVTALNTAPYIPTTGNDLLVNDSARTDFGFHVALTDAVADLNAKWASSKAATIVGQRTFAGKVTVGAVGCDYTTIQAAVTAVAASAVDAAHRYAVIVNNGTYTERVTPPNGKFIDIIGVSRTGVLWICNAADGEPVYNLGNDQITPSTATDGLVGHLTMLRLNGNAGSAYCIHSDDGGIAGRTCIYLDLQLNGDEGSSYGIGIGAWSGEKHYLLGCDSPKGMWAHTNSGAEIAATNVYVIDCRDGLPHPLCSYPPQGWEFNTFDTGQRDRCFVRGGVHQGSGYGIKHVKNGTGTPLGVLYTDNVVVQGGTAATLYPDATQVYIDSGAWYLAASSVVYGADCGNGTTGTLTLPNTDGSTPDASLVKNTAHFGPDNATAGTLDVSAYTLISGVAAAADVRNGTPRYSGGGNGTCYVPSAANVVSGVAVDATTGAYPTTAATQAAQHNTDAAFLETHKAEIVPADTAILAEFGVTGTAPSGGGSGLTTEEHNALMAISGPVDGVARATFEKIQLAAAATPKMTAAANGGNTTLTLYAQDGETVVLAQTYPTATGLVTSLEIGGA